MKRNYTLFGALLLLCNIHVLYSMNDTIPSSKWRKNRAAKSSKNHVEAKPQIIDAQSKFHLKSLSELHKTFRDQNMPSELMDHIYELMI